MTLAAIIGSAAVTWFLVSLGGICIDGIQTNCNDRWRPLAAGVCVCLGGIVALVALLSHSRHAVIALYAAFVWNVLVVVAMNGIYLAEWPSRDQWGQLVLLLPWNVLLLVPAALYIVAAREATTPHPHQLTV